MRPIADLIFINCTVITMDDALPFADSLVVINDTIKFAGERDEALLWQGEKTEVVDLDGKTVLPGFIESHIHPTIYGLNLLELDYGPSETPSIHAILEKVKQEADSLPDGEWIRGWGWDDSKLIERRNPTRRELDKVSPNHPVMLRRTCGHMAVVNSKALELSKITDATPDPQGGHLERENKTGNLTGLVQEKAQGMIAVPEYGQKDIIKGMKLAQQNFAKWGITTVHDMSCQTLDFQAYQYLYETNALTVRVRPWMWAIEQNGLKGSLQEVLSVGLRSGFGNDMIKIQGMKFMLDGSVGGRTAAVAEPFADDDSTGILYNTTAEIAPLFQQSIEAGLRVAVHGIGERAIEVAISAFEKANESADISRMRNRIEHCALPTDDHLKRMKKLELIAASSIGFLYDIGDSYLANLGAERMERVYPHKSFQEHGIVAPGNSDLPVTNGNPWLGIYAAVTRKTISGKILDNRQNILLLDALKAYTVNAAYSSFEEQTIGVLKPASKADFIIVSANPFEVNEEKLKDIQVEATYGNGKLLYSQSITQGRKDDNDV